MPWMTLIPDRRLELIQVPAGTASGASRCSLGTQAARKIRSTELT